MAEDLVFTQETEQRLILLLTVQHVILEAVMNMLGNLEIKLKLVLL